MDLIPPSKSVERLLITFRAGRSCGDRFLIRICDNLTSALNGAHTPKNFSIYWDCKNQMQRKQPPRFRSRFETNFKFDSITRIS